MSLEKAHLKAEELLSPTVPLSWGPIIKELQDFVRLERRLRLAPSDASLSDDLERLHLRLLNASSALLEPQEAEPISDIQTLILFAKSVLILARLKRSVIAPGGVIDTAGSRTLGLYESDFYLEDDVIPTLKARLCEALGLDQRIIEELDFEVSRLSEDQTIKTNLVSAIKSNFNLAAPKEEIRHAIKNLCAEFFPEFPTLGRNSELIVTSTHIFVCVPSPSEKDRDDESVKKLNQRIERFGPSQLGNFPAFGFVERDELRMELVRALAEKSGLTDAQVYDEIPKVVTVLRLEDVDRYIIHDTWGHGWQATLLQFEDMFVEMKSYCDPLALRDSCVLGDGTIVRLQDCFLKNPAGKLELDRDLCRDFFVRTVVRRFPAVTTGILGEMLADVAEFKFVDLNPTMADLMPNSSFFKFLPTKLDLTFQDLEHFFGLALRSLDQWAHAELAAPTELSHDLAHEASVGSGEAHAALREAASIWTELRRTTLGTEIQAEEVNDNLKINVFARLALNFLTINQGIIQAYQALQNRSPLTSLPLKSYRDLLIIGTAAFFEEDRVRNIWRIDEFLSLRFIPICHRFSL